MVSMRLVVAHSGCGWVRLFEKAPVSSLAGVAGCVGWNKRWKVEPRAQWESNQEKGFLWIRPRPYWRGGLSVSCLKWLRRVHRTLCYSSCPGGPPAQSPATWMGCLFHTEDWAT